MGHRWMPACAGVTKQGAFSGSAAAAKPFSMTQIFEIPAQVVIQYMIELAEF
jgi:hypothetical protein